MAKLRNNPLGDPIGKFGNVVGGKWKDGIYWIRSRIFPAQRGTFINFKSFKADGTPRQFSYKQMNIRQCMKILGHTARLNMDLLIIPIWEDLAQRLNLKMSGANLFVKTNLPGFFASMPNKSQELVLATNAPLMSSLKMADGNLEGTPILTAVYTTGTGSTTVTWSPTCFTNGLATDKTWFAFTAKPLLESVGVDGTWKPKMYVYGPLGGSVARSVGTATFNLPAGLTAADLTAHLFFRDLLTIGYSISDSAAVTAP